MEYKSIIPNTTQIPHVIIREWMPHLKDVELRVLLVIADQTLGWIEDKETGRRKEKDWISHYQLRQKTGRKDRAISAALKVLIEKNGIVEAYDEAGNLLDTTQKRQKVGTKIYYRLCLQHPPATLFETPAKFTGVSKKRLPPQNLRTQNLRTTKETHITKEIHAAKPRGNEKPIQPPKQENSEQQKTRKPHSQFVEFWHETCYRARGVKPVITGKDARNLKRVLDMKILSQSQLEQLAVYFLAHPTFRKFSPSIATFLSSGILNGLMNRSRNDGNFWKELDMFASSYVKEPEKSEKSVKSVKSEMVERLAELKVRLFKEPFTPQERTRIQEEIAAVGRARQT